MLAEQKLLKDVTRTADRADQAATDRGSLRWPERYGYNHDPLSNVWPPRVNSTPPQPAAASAVTVTNAVEMADVTFGYNRRQPVLKGITMTIPRGKVVAIMGGSGCGKTTILRLIGGQLRQQSGARARRRPIGARPVARSALRAAPPDRHAVPVRRAVHRHDRCSRTSRFRCASIPTSPMR